MCVGDNPTAIMEKYNMSAKVEPYIKYKYLDAEKYLKTSITVQTKLLENFDKMGLDDTIKEKVRDRVQRLKAMTSFEYYKELTDGLFYDKNGNALSEENPNGRWVTCSIGKNFSIPLKTAEGEVYSATMKDIRWDEMHLANQEVYKAAWELCVEGRDPINESEESIKKAMGDKQVYFAKFKDKDAYVRYNTAYWNYAYVDENVGWVDITTAQSDSEWTNTFYDKFVKVIDPNSKITIFECTVKSNEN